MIDVNYFLGQTAAIQIALIFAIVATRAIVLAGGSSLWIQLSKWANTRQIIAGQISRKKMFIEALQGLKIVLLDSIFTVTVIKLGLFHFQESATPLQYLAVFALMFIWTEIYFYYSHVIFHHPKFFWIHRHHHQSALLNPWTSLSFSLLERLILLLGVVMVPALVSGWIPFPAEPFVTFHDVRSSGEDGLLKPERSSVHPVVFDASTVWPIW